MEDKKEIGIFRRRLSDVLLMLMITVVSLYSILVYLGITGRGMESIIASLLIGILATEVVGVVIYAYFSRRIAQEEAGPLRNLFRVTAYIVLAIIILAELKVDITGILVSAGFLGIILGLAAQSTISNFIAGIYLLSSKAFEPGDNVIIHTWQYNLTPPSYPHDRFVPGFSGTIKSIGVLYTELTNDEKLPMLVPNSIVAQAMVINYHKAKEHMTKIQFDVDTRIRYSEIEKRVSALMRREKIDDYRIDIDYLSTEIYVVTLRIKIDTRDRVELRTALYSDILTYLNAELMRLKK